MMGRGGNGAGWDGGAWSVMTLGEPAAEARAGLRAAIDRVATRAHRGS